MNNYILKIRHALNAAILPVGNNKIPLNKKWQSVKLTSQELESYTNASSYGLVCGTISGGIEVLDIDLKILDTKEERDIYEKDLLSYLDDNVDNFYKKVAIYRTLNNGLHIIYKAGNIEGNQKLAKVKGKTEAVIETRGIGGYVQIYPDFHHKGLKYEEVTKITNEDRSILIECCKSLNEEVKEEIQPKETKKEKHQQEGLSPWVDYNERTNVFDLVSNEFTIVKQLTNHTIIKRIGAESLTSGKIFHDSNCIYLHSTGTRYEAEKLLSPYTIYTLQNHNGDFTASSKDLYNQGFGARFEPVKYEFKEEEEPQIKANEFPIEVFPKELQHYIKENKEKLGLVSDFMGSGLLWVASSVIGNSLNIQIKKGWTDNCTVWIACVAPAGVGKSPSIGGVTKTFEKLNQKEQKLFAKEEKKSLEYKNLDKEEKKYKDEPKEPINKQFLANDITLEALTGLLSQNPNGVGVLKDELNGWVQDMNKYRDGSDLSFWLSSFNGMPYSSNRKTAGNTFVDAPYVPVIGGIQPSILNDLATSERQESGFMDRLLLSHPKTSVNKFNDDELDEDLIDWYSGYVRGIIEQVKGFININSDNEVVPLIASFNKEAKAEYKRIFNEITDKQNSDDSDEKLKSVLPKMKIYLGRFALITRFIKWSLNTDIELLEIEKEDVQNAEKLVRYFTNNATSNKKLSKESFNLKEIIRRSGELSTKGKIAAIVASGIKATQKQIAQEVGVSVRTVLRHLSK